MSLFHGATWSYLGVTHSSAAFVCSKGAPRRAPESKTGTVFLIQVDADFMVIALVGTALPLVLNALVMVDTRRKRDAKTASFMYPTTSKNSSQW